MKKIAFICKDGLENFLVDLCNELSSYFEISLFLVRSKEEVDKAVQYGDIVWFEWADDITIYGSQSPIVRHKKSVVRLHRYEAFTHMPINIDWSAISCLVLVNDAMREVVRRAIGNKSIFIKQTKVIHNGVNLDRYTFGQHRPGHNIAWVGHINARKNLPLALQIIKCLVGLDCRYVLHIAGDFQDFEQELYARYFVMNNRLENNVIFHGWVNDINAWLDDKSYLLSTSIHESFGYAIAEAMAKGIKPIIHEFHGAYALWSPDHLFFNIDSAISKITKGSYEPVKYRQFIEDTYSLNRQVNSTREMLEGL